MSYATLMVHCTPGEANTGVLAVAGALAKQFDASILGIATCQPMQIVYGDNFYSGDFIQQDRDEIERELKAAEVEFWDELKPRNNRLMWRSCVGLGPMSDFLTLQARNADLIVTAARLAGPDLSRGVDIGELVMRAGRPVLVVPPDAAPLALDHAMLAWKDTRETRRAASDALPLLRKAKRVTVVQVAAEAALNNAADGVGDVVSWLQQHGISAAPLAVPSTGDDSLQLSRIAQDRGADIVVAGAYGHSRLREWAFGGVTRDLLVRADRCSLVSH